jgi:hypothetical protein
MLCPDDGPFKIATWLDSFLSTVSHLCRATQTCIGCIVMQSENSKEIPSCSSQNGGRKAYGMGPKATFERAEASSRIRRELERGDNWRCSQGG